MVLIFMKNGIYTVRAAACSLALLSTSFCVFSQTSTEKPNASLPDVVVSATRIAQPLAQAIADVTVIDRAEIERSGSAALGDVLARLPGFEISRNGGPASTTGVFLRGAETRFTAVYIDGVRIDSQSTGGAAWQAIPLSQIDRIEVVRGAAGAVYGSDAIAGAIQIFTRKGEVGVHPYVGLGVGTYATYKIEAGVSGADASWNYALGIARDSSDGFNATTSTSANPDKDGFTAESATARLGFKVNAEHRLDASFMSNQQSGQYDSSPVLDDLTIQKLQTASLRWQAQWTPQYRSTVSVGSSLDRYETTPSVYLTDTNIKTFYWQNEYRSGTSLFSAALERRDDSLSNASTTPRDTSHFQNALALGYNWVEGAQSLQLNVRRDEDSAFGGQNTGSLGYGYAASPQWRLTGTVGNAFRAPTLFQRFSIYGSPNLQAETGQNVEAGLRYSGDEGNWGITAYSNEVSNLIVFDGSVPAGTCAGANGTRFGGCYGNIAKARYEGVTISAAREFGSVSARASLDFQNPRDLSTGNLLARRARQHAVLAIEAPWSGWVIGSELQLSSLRYGNAANTIELAGYGLFNLYAQTKIGKDLTALLRLDNANDAQYQLANGYATAGRSWYAGLKWAL
jgi:vitamin B12 transporter